MVLYIAFAVYVFLKAFFVRIIFSVKIVTYFITMFIIITRVIKDSDRIVFARFSALIL